MSDDLSDPHASAPHLPSPRESIPPSDEPKTPAWLTWVGLGLLLVVLGWIAVRCGMRDEQPSNGAAVPLALPKER